MATHKRPALADPFENAAHWELAKTYLKMGLQEDALNQVRILAKHYKSSGMEDKALKVMALMARIDSSKPGSGKEITGLKHPMKLKDGGPVIVRSEETAIREAGTNQKGREGYSDLGAELGATESEDTRKHRESETSEEAPGWAVNFKRLRTIPSRSSMDPNSNYNAGMACLKSGFIDDAIQQFQIAYEKREHPFEAARFLGLCFKEKTMWAEAIQAFEKALKVGGISQGDTLAVKCELGLIFKEQGKTEKALDLFR